MRSLVNDREYYYRSSDLDSFPEEHGLVTTVNARPGFRVVPGVDWEWGNQHGHSVGTIRDVPDDRGICWVTWDANPSKLYNYRIGFDGCFDLLYASNLGNFLSS